MMTCPSCGRKTAEGAFCTRCGAKLGAVAPSEPTMTEAKAVRAIEEQVKVVETRIAQETSDARLSPRRQGEPTLEVDKLLPLFENMNGTLRFRFNPAAGNGQLENVVITFSNCYCERKPVFQIRRARQVQEFPVQFPPQGVGLQSWNVTVEYLSAQRKHVLTGDFQVIVKPIESRKRGADNFNINIQTTIGNVGNASDVTVNQRGAEGLAELIASADPFEEMSRAFMSERREWTPIAIFDDNEVVDLPPQPTAARTDRVVLDIGRARLHFFANRTVKFGRKRETNDFVLRPSAGASETETLPYRKVSREHCLFEHSGANVLVTDGSRNEAGIVQPSSCGTFWNNEQLRGPLELPAGTQGVVSFGGIYYGDNLSLDLKACSPSKACASCPHANTGWCGEGRHPSVMLTRRDGQPETFVGLWSCFDLGEADPSYAGVVIFRKEGAFAYRTATGHTDWLTPGTTIQTDFGQVAVN